MNQQITLTVSDNVWFYAKAVATRSKQRVEDVLSDWLEKGSSEIDLEKLSDSEILALTKMKISAERQKRLSDLLFKNRETGLNKNEQSELDLMLEISELNMLKKAEALQIAVKRGLIEPLSLQ
jgi:exoribonuclease II